MSEDYNGLSFSQRNGIEPIPEQLKLEQISIEFRRLIHFALSEEIDRVSKIGYGGGGYFDGGWLGVAKNLHVRFLGHSISSFKNEPASLLKQIERLLELAKYNQVFDFIEFLAGQGGCTSDLKRDLAQGFVEARTAYRLKDNQVIAIGTDEQAEAFLRAIDDAEKQSTSGARMHLIDAGKKLAVGDWKGSIRDSIHAVEAASINLAAGGTLGPALDELERRGNLHGALKRAFKALYGFTSDKATGVRHADVFGNGETVDEADALFMLGACASFVSYLIARNV